MPISVAYLRHRKPVDYGTAPGSTTISRRGSELFRRFVNLATAALGASSGDSEYTLVYTATDPACAVAGITTTTAGTSLTATINGAAVAVTPAGGDITSCGLLAQAINASTNALVQGFVQASNLSATLTLTSVTAGATVDICGTRFTATNGTPPESVSGGNLCTFTMAGTDTADALALANAINAAPGVSRYVAAISVVGVVHLFARQAVASGTNAFTWATGPVVPPNSIVSQSSTIVASTATLAATAKVGIVACTPGVLSNAFTIVAASGTGTTATLGTQTRLIGGAGLNIVGVNDGCR
jgi:hypothetical protein